MIDKTNITGIILAGGKSSRMGTDKGFLLLNGKPFISHIIEALKPWVNNIIIVSNNSDYDVFKMTRVEDIIENSGPIAGIYSGLKYSKSEYNLVLSCDVPLINKSVLNQLIEGFDDKMDVVQIQSQGKTMPLIAIYKKQCMKSFLELLQKGERRLRIAVGNLKTKTIKLDSNLDQYVRNINTTEELKALRYELEH